MNTKESIRKAYDLAAADYAEKWWDEFKDKHFDRLILTWYASQIPEDGRVLEIGSGPGEVSGFLSRCGTRCLGTDGSPLMIENAKKYFPNLDFEVQDYFGLTYGEDAFEGVVAYYAIVNLELPEVLAVLKEVRRVLKPGGLFLFTFHTLETEESLTVESFFGKEGGTLTFYYFRPEDMERLVREAGFNVVDILVRFPYADAEYPSRRAYFIVRKP